MKNIKYLFITGTIVFSAMFGSASANESFFDWLIDFSRHKGVAPTANEAYEEECGACHFPYQPGLLPKQSWNKLFEPKQLSDHFGDNAELDEKLRAEFNKYVTENSADNSWYKRSRKIMASLEENQYPIRITEIPYIKNKHKDISVKLIRDNKKVGSLSYCDKCHRSASKGIYDDDTVLIPQ